MEDRFRVGAGCTRKHRKTISILNFKQNKLIIYVAVFLHQFFIQTIPLTFSVTITFLIYYQSFLRI